MIVPLDNSGTLTEGTIMKKLVESIEQVVTQLRKLSDEETLLSSRELYISDADDWQEIADNIKQKCPGAAAFCFANMDTSSRDSISLISNDYMRQRVADVLHMTLLK